MIRSLLYIWALIFFISALGSCSKASEDVLMPQQCDTVGMKYSRDILPIIAANCYSCHANGIVNGDVSLDGYANLKIQAGNGNLIGVITHANGYPPMPDNGGKLSDCEINKIKAWIAGGAGQE
ncbi:cytochrome c [Agriterribacter sp.]|uniref:cytochrome c n=1 Tax=Agriterribacter sp. TaxID=2821509 RepID=UPI002B7519EC|nr:cytochrome c [Agriterribacter sp.]HRO45702.1 cytochrome c [Agriterribacter sp.]HRQ15820.1 cytochrome c [Agriterribacter sp.]